MFFFDVKLDSTLNIRSQLNLSRKQATPFHLVNKQKAITLQNSHGTNIIRMQRPTKHRANQSANVNI